LEQEVADEEAMLARRKALEEAVVAVRDRITAHEEAGAAAAAELAAARDRAVRLASLTDRLTATAELAAERVRLLGQDEEVETTEQRARAGEAREGAEQAYSREQERIATLAQRAADRREGLARLAGQVGARRSRIEAAEAEIGRLRESATTALARAEAAEREF